VQDQTFPSCATRKLKLITEESASWKIQQTITMQGERVVTLLVPSRIQNGLRIRGLEKSFFLVNLRIYRISKKIISFYFQN